MSYYYIKVTFFKDISKISYIISCEPLPVLNSPIELTISDYIRGNEPIHRYKTLNYYQNLISGESIIKDHKNRILETGYANIFVQLEDKIFTPPAYLPILPGTFRQYLLNMGEYNGYKIMEKELFVEDIDLFDKVYITNSLRGIIPISKIIR
ncbi:MAG: hypothetical protein B6229_08600 [Spirochaetaceae bacterium 4572_7]|nr:MAG: hypothetical protein B6229_08600 [Spirochaetaceae bacterium 4572_7]